LKDVEKMMGLPVLARIRDDKKVVRAVFHRTPVGLHDDSSHVSREVERFVSALVGVPETPSLLHRIFPKKHFSKDTVNRDFMRQKFYECRI
jgi:septum formation inhibitor-activating ATPase MinD